MTDKTLRRLFQEETGIHWKDSNGNPLISYVQYLEEIVVKNNAVLPFVRSCCLDPNNRKFKNSENGIEWYCTECSKAIPP